MILLIIAIDSALATEYMNAYHRALESREKIKRTFVEFTAGFMEDQLAAELTFFDEKIANVRR